MHDKAEGAMLAVLFGGDIVRRGRRYLQNNTNLNVGSEAGALNVLNVQPVVPLSLNESWNVIRSCNYYFPSSSRPK